MEVVSNLECHFMKSYKWYHGQYYAHHHHHHHHHTLSAPPSLALPRVWTELESGRVTGKLWANTCIHGWKPLGGRWPFALLSGRTLSLDTWGYPLSRWGHRGPEWTGLAQGHRAAVVPQPKQDLDCSAGLQAQIMKFLTHGTWLAASPQTGRPGSLGLELCVCVCTCVKRRPVWGKLRARHKLLLHSQPFFLSQPPEEEPPTRFWAFLFAQSSGLKAW